MLQKKKFPKKLLKKKKMMMKMMMKMKKKKKKLLTHWILCVKNVPRPLLVSHLITIFTSVLRESPKNKKNQIMNTNTTKKIVLKSFSICNTV